MEASTLTYAGKRGLLSRPSPLLRLESDENLVALTREGHQSAFETLVSRYQGRLLGFCRQMLRSTEDAEDVLQEVFVAAYNAMIADDRPINVKPWLYRIARNRSLNHLRKPVADGQDSMDMHSFMNGVSAYENVEHREEFRNVISDVSRLPETQRTALLLREMDAMSYSEIAQAMDTTIPSVKSLLVRARIGLAECSESRGLSCEEVRVDLAEAAEGIQRLSGPVRKHVKSCDSCTAFRKQLRSDSRALAAALPIAPMILLKGKIAALFSGIGSGGGAGSIGGAGVASIGGSGAAGGISAVGAAVGSKAAAGIATAALLTAGAVGIEHEVNADRNSGRPSGTVVERQKSEPPATPAIANAETAAAVESPVVESEEPATTGDPASPTGETNAVADGETSSTGGFSDTGDYVPGATTPDPVMPEPELPLPADETTESPDPVIESATIS
ncbi:MAG: RNA polymerase sigma factor [bacterium]